MNDGTVYVLLVTDGTVIEYPPEVYASERRARLEAERWAWVLAGGGWSEITSPFDGRWEVAGRDVRLVPADRGEGLGDIWVCTYWTEDGQPDPEALIVSGRDDARAWVTQGPARESPDDLTEHPWMLVAMFYRGGEEAYAVAWLAKVIE